MCRLCVAIASSVSFFICYEWKVSPFSRPYPQSVGLLGRGISPSQGLYLQTELTHNSTDIHALSGIRTHDPNVPANEDVSCLRPRGHCNRQYCVLFSFLFAATLEHKADFLVSLIILFERVWLLGRGISSSQGIYLNTRLHKHRLNTCTQETSMPCVWFEPTIFWWS
jgi:hypothetical protein